MPVVCKPETDANFLVQESSPDKCLPHKVSFQWRDANLSVQEPSPDKCVQHKVGFQWRDTNLSVQESSMDATGVSNTSDACAVNECERAGTI